MLPRTLRGVLLFTLVLFTAQSMATIQSRATTGSSWTGQVVINSDVMRVKIKPYYLDVEEDLILGPYSTGSAPTSGQNQLEMWGTFTLPANAVIVGAFIWKADSSIMKAKLKSKNLAQSQYEAVVNRQAAPQPRPRDPMLIEQVGTNQYNLDIYPVTWNGYRKIRIRYLIPQQYINGELKMPLTLVFASQVAKVPNWIEIDLNKGYTNLSSILYDNGQTVTTVTLPSTQLRQYSSLTNYIKLPSGASREFILAKMPSGVSAGNYLMLWLKPPDTLLTRAQAIRNPASVAVAIKNAKKTYSFSIPGTVSGSTMSFQPLRFAAHSLSAWNTQLTWTAYDSAGTQLVSYNPPVSYYSGDNDTALVKLFAGSDASLSEVYTTGGFGYLFGVVDMNFSLLALESDTLGKALSKTYADSGLPHLTDSEIFKPQIVAARPSPAVKKQDEGLSVVQVGRNLFRIDIGAMREIVQEIRIMDCKGRVIATVAADKFASRGVFVWDAQGIAARTAGGVYFVSAVCRTGVISRRILVL